MTAQTSQHSLPGTHRALPTPHVQALAAIGAVRRYRAKALLIQQGDRGDTIFILQTGQLRVFLADTEGKEVTLALYGPGEYVGEMSLDGGPRSANVEATEASVCAAITREQLLHYIGQHPDFALEMMAKLIRRARLATESAGHLALIDVYGRLRLLLESWTGPPLADDSRPLMRKTTHLQLAQHLACSREMVSRLLKDLENGGFIRQTRGQVVLLRALPQKW